ncbi:GGDEF domain-containing protein [Thiohalophilus thiocyanatoxydans]|uniref:Diguanylate cyclase (GGDEF)-like protein n=1 Tax=Thiohalophilus thiocyanatoxydans TaxID=381308 RepID=A0A4V3H3H7_9GAMM|nr:GGDEF domain-containing protein [Thiohalophilus thiocyanatoxydans]TDX99324.1 diguanylate cyclase (GGDEF)-like protein [Thiohalophilus thiocyanatoxydans]
MGTRQEYNKLRFIGLFIGTAIIGLVLILIAVYNASRELVIVKEINTLHDILSERRDANAFPNIKALAADEYTVGHLSGKDTIAVPGVPSEVSRTQLEASRLNEQGGYLEIDGTIITWASSAIMSGGDGLLVAHRHRPPDISTLFGVYRNRLIIPAVFYIWATVWTSFILNNLVSRLRAQKAKLERMAWYDTLTGLPNRNLMFQRLDELIHREKKENTTLTLAVVDLDGFKQVNDNFGHHAGDELLREVANRFTHLVRHDDLVARTGGDEFVLLLTDQDPRVCEAICERILEALSEPYTLTTQTTRIGASLGLACYPRDGRDITELTRKADEAMYQAKRSGGGIVCYSGDDPIPAGV